MKRPFTSFSDIDLNFNDILVRLGYASGKTIIDNKTKEIIENEMNIAKMLFEPGQVISNIPYTSSEEGVINLSGGLCIKSANVSKLFTGSIEVYGFAVTIGRHLL